MSKKNLWFVARVVIVLINVIGLPMIVSERTNFGVLDGVICGTVALAAIFFWMRIQPKGNEMLGALWGPFWPMRQYPMTYWLTIGGALSIAAFLNLLISIGDRRSVEFFGGVLMLGLGMTLAPVLANRFPMKMRGS